MIRIKEPLWKGNLAFDKRTIVIAEHHLKNEGYMVDIEIEYRTKKNIQSYASVYQMELRQIIKYPQVYINGNSNLPGREIPIKDLKVKPDINITKIVNCPLNTNKVEILAVQKSLWE